jgi:hypothetical protein
MESSHSLWSHFSSGFLLSTILQYYSPTPFNVTQGTNSIQGTALRPCAPGITNCIQALPGTVIGHNAGVGFNFFNVNARLSRTFPLGDRFHLETIAEAFNALNHRNDLIPNAIFGTGTYPNAANSSFGKPTAVGDPRQVQLAVRLTF